MRWRTPVVIKPREPKPGDRRNITKFAFFPTKLTDGNSVWLERYTVGQELAAYYKDLHSSITVLRWKLTYSTIKG